MLNPELNITKAFKVQAEINIEISFSAGTMMPVRKLLPKGNTRLFTLIFFYESRKNTKFKVLSSIVYFIMDDIVCVDFMCFPETKIHVTCKVQGFGNRTYNAVSIIGIPEILMNIISCHGFVNNTKSAVILLCRNKLVDYYLQKRFIFSKQFKSLLEFFFTCETKNPHRTLIYK